MVIAEVVKETQRGCLQCEKVGEDIEPEPLYECGSCGNEFSRSNSADGGSHRCPQCNKFGSKISDEGCPDCEVELEDLDTYIYKDKTYTDEDDLIKAIKENGETLPDFLQEIDMKNKETRRKADEEQKQRELEKIAEQKKHKEFKTIEEVEQSFKDFLNAIQSPLLKLVQSKDSVSNYGTKQYINKDENGDIRWYLHFEVTWNINNDKYVDLESSSMSKTNLFYADLEEASMKYMGMESHINNIGSSGFFML
jgi:DNA-directed RNA polymerase subunit RPC12/RpoP